MNLNFNHRSICGLTSRLVISITLLILLSGDVSAQNLSGSTPLGLAPGSPQGSYNLSEFENINFHNGNLSFGLPLLQISGRGGASMPLMLRLEQKWHTQRWRSVNGDGQVSAVPAWWTYNAPTFTPGHVYARASGDLFKSCYPYCGSSYENGFCMYSRSLTRLTFTAPNGTEYELRDQLTNGRPMEPACNSAQGPLRGTVFVTSDGSSATFISDEVIYDKPWSDETYGVSGYLKLRDGTTYRVEVGLIKWMRDRNGNKMSFEYTYVVDTMSGQGSFPNLTKITDSLNRKVEIFYSVTDPVRGLCYKITYTGFDTTPRTIYVTYAPLEDVLRADATLKTYLELFDFTSSQPDGPITPTDHFNPYKVSAVWLPDNRKYQFRYNSYGELARAELPTGGWIQYEFATGIDVSNPLPGIHQSTDSYRRLIERRDSTGSLLTIGKPEIGNNIYHPSVGQYSYETSNLGYVDVAQYDGSDFLHEKHYFYGSVSSTFDQDGLAYATWMDGKEYRTDVLGVNGELLRKIERVWQQREHVDWWPQSASLEPPNDPRIVETITTLADTGQVTKRSAINPATQAVGFDQFSNQTDVWEYGYGQGSAGSLIRHTHTDYLTTNALPSGTTNYTANDIHIRSLPIKQSVFDASGVEKARTTYEYDNYTSSPSDLNHSALTARTDISGLCATIVNHQCESSGATTQLARGNVTSVSRWFMSAGSPTGQKISAYSQYDVAGNVVKAIDPMGKATTVVYDDHFGIPDGDARPNTPPSELGALKSYAFATSVTNVDLGFTSHHQFNFYMGAVVDSEDANGVVSSIYYADPLGRKTKIVRAANTALHNQMTFNYDDGNHIVAITNDLNNYNDNVLVRAELYDEMGRTFETRAYEGASYTAVRKTYDILGRVKQVSNPFRPTTENPVWTTMDYDDLSRVESVTTPDGAQLTTDYSGNQVTNTDPAGKVRRSVIDALGRVERVIEAPNNPAYNFSSTYTYDVLDNLRTIVQGEQTRSFEFDGLGRMTSVWNPEAGTISLQYDNNGNVERRTDARGVAANFSYDALSRLTSVSYDVGQTGVLSTPTVTYTYDDPEVFFSRGRLTSVSSSVSTTRFVEFDALGRIKRSTQTTDGKSYPMSYNYSLAGQMTSQTYPSGRTVSTAYDSAGRINEVSGQKSGESNRLYFSQPTYTPHGSLASMRMGNGLWEHSNYNTRLQPTEVGLGNSSTDSSILKLEYKYGLLVNNVLDPTRNNGSVQSQIMSFPGLTANQKYTYDELNRLTVAEENNGASWKQTFIYDRYGNRSSDVNNTSAGMVGPNPDISTANNQIVPRTGEFYHYDAAGNLDRDKDNNVLGYNAESRLATYNGGASPYTSGADYGYDGLGKRVKKVTSEGETIFVYSAVGQLVAEYTTAALQGNGGTSYLTTDALGTPRVITNANGAVKARHDYLSFGEEIYSGTGGRAEHFGYRNDRVRQKFTGHERDLESGLDYAQARHYANTQGRFTSPDPLLASASIAAPQTFNRYAYVLNNPQSLTDPLGLLPQSGVKEDNGTQEDKRKDPKPGDTFIVDLGGTKYTVTIGSVEITKPKSYFDYIQLLNSERWSAANGTPPNGPANSMSGTSGDGTGLIQLFAEFATGAGARTRQFGPDSILTKDMRTSPDVTAHRDSYCRGSNCSTRRNPYEGGFRFGLIGWGFGWTGQDGALRALASGRDTRSFVGSFTITIQEVNSDHDALFTLTNPTSRTSLFLQNPFFGDPEHGPLSTTTQTYWWVESNPCKCKVIGAMSGR
jgi:RHS repeat-associated protein